MTITAGGSVIENDTDLIRQYPSQPPNLLILWNEARRQVARAGEAYVAAGRPAHGHPLDMALHAAEDREHEAWERLFTRRYHLHVGSA